MLRKLKKKGFVSIIEVIVTSVIFILAAFGIFSSISMLRLPSFDSSKRLDAAYTGRKFIENLRNSISISAGIYTAGTLYTNTVPGGLANYTIKWYVKDDASTGVRQLYMNVTY